jgi:hypothetical protein
MAWGVRWLNFDNPWQPFSLASPFAAPMDVVRHSSQAGIRKKVHAEFNTNGEASGRPEPQKLFASLPEPEPVFR